MGTFEFIGDRYEKASKHQKEWGNNLISELSLKGSERILDMGCGDGALTEQLAILVPDGSVLGIDASIGMIHTAQKHKRENLKFVQMDINSIEFKDEFDIIFSNAALHWVKDHKLLLNNTYRAMKSNGELLWNFAGDGNCSNFYKVIKSIIRKNGYKEYFDEFQWPWFMPSKREYEKLMENTGFFKVTVLEENADRYFADVDEMNRWLDQPSLVPFLACILDEQRKETFRNEVLEEMMQRTIQTDGTCFETFRRLKIHAIK